MDEDNRARRIQDRIFGTDLHPRHESWARISSSSTLIGFVVFLVLAGLFILWIEWLR